MVEVYKRESQTLDLTYEVNIVTDYLLVIPEKKKGIYYKPGYEYEIKIVDDPREMLDKDATFFKLDEGEAREIFKEVKSRIRGDISREMYEIERSLAIMRNLRDIMEVLF